MKLPQDKRRWTKAKFSLGVEYGSAHASGPDEPSSRELVPKVQHDDEAGQDPYFIAGRELQDGSREPGAWARALVESDGNIAKTEAAYVKFRVAALQLGELEREAESQAQRAEEERRQNRREAIRLARAIAEQRVAEERAAEIVRIETAGGNPAEARLRVAALFAARSSPTTEIRKIPEVQELAHYLNVDISDAMQLAQCDIFKRGDHYIYDGRRFPWLSGALIAAKAS